MSPRGPENGPGGSTRRASSGRHDGLGSELVSDTDYGEVLRDDAFLTLVREEDRARQEIRMAGRDSARKKTAKVRLAAVLDGENVLNSIAY